jgi:hypothetical protein
MDEEALPAQPLKDGVSPDSPGAASINSRGARQRLQGQSTRSQVAVGGRARATESGGGRWVSGVRRARSLGGRIARWD